MNSELLDVLKMMNAHFEAIEKSLASIEVSIRMISNKGE